MTETIGDRKLVEKGTELDSKDNIYGQTPLLWPTVKLLLEKGAKLEFKDAQGWTLLSFTTKNGHKAVVKVVISIN